VRHTTTKYKHTLLFIEVLKVNNIPFLMVFPQTFDGVEEYNKSLTVIHRYKGRGFDLIQVRRNGGNACIKRLG